MADDPSASAALAQAAEAAPGAGAADEEPEVAEAAADPGQDASAGEGGSTPAPAAEPPFEHSLELVLEALLLAADLPLSIEQMQRLVGSEFNLSRRELRHALEHMQARYADSACELHEVASGWRLQVRAEYGQWVSRLWQEKPPRYSRALLETLALIVYRQPVTRGEIEDVRGVTVSTNILRTLLERGWVREVGHKEVPGRPALYGTTPQFLDDFNLKSLDQLPSLPEVKDLEQIEAALLRVGQALDSAGPAGTVPAEGEEQAAAGAAPPEAETGGVPPDAVVH
ncbi:MAG: SMC-Scp complex subunit ScpB [Nevskia sp.]|nr:SMC-Scp complex subunit ScpB [Nevskia sp.]